MLTPLFRSSSLSAFLSLSHIPFPIDVQVAAWRLPSSVLPSLAILCPLCRDRVATKRRRHILAVACGSTNTISALSKPRVCRQFVLERRALLRASTPRRLGFGREHRRCFDDAAKPLTRVSRRRRAAGLTLAGADGGGGVGDDDVGGVNCCGNGSPAARDGARGLSVDCSRNSPHSRWHHRSGAVVPVRLATAGGADGSETLTTRWRRLTCVR